jgi:N-acetylglucosaminyl-diphospho-decaprenol L-rhamnosyltransferase
MANDEGSPEPLEGPGRGPIEVLTIIVNYKSAQLTLGALAALARECDHPSLELEAIVVENASGDAELLAREIDARFKSFARLVVSEHNGGFGAGNNLGLSSALQAGKRPRYVFFLNPDTEVRPGAVAELVRFLEEHPRAGIAGSSFEHADGSMWPIAFRFPSPLSELEGGAATGVLSRLLKSHTVARNMGSVPEQVDWISGASMMFRLTTLEDTGGFDERFFLYYEEIDLCVRARRAGWECWYVPQSRVMHIRGQSTGVTVLDEKPKRLPKYWFESRRRYFAKNDGYAMAVAADVAFLVGNGLGLIKRKIKGEHSTPHLIRDLVRESVVWPHNREVLPPKYFSGAKS